MPTSDRESLAQSLRDSDVRVTPQRLAVLEELAREPNDATAQTLWRRLRARRGAAIGLATVYRALALLRDAGVVDELSHGNEACYRLCGDEHHHHLLCRSCHRVVEVEDCELGPWVTRVARRHGFAALEHRLEITGLCADCRG